MSELITVKNLTVAYGSNVVISSASFIIKKGDFICVVGQNGSGKSTLIKALLGLIRPRSGKISFGQGIKQNSIGYLPQEPKQLQNFPASVFEIVLSGTLGRLGHLPFYRKEDRSRAESSLDTLNIKNLKDKKFSELSGGQKQKVLLARALAATSSFLILDEPSNNLDHASRKSFYETLKSLNKNTGLTILMITHDLDSEDLIGNKVLSLKNGKISSFTTVDFLRRYK